jgi:hypothetical protein
MVAAPSAFLNYGTSRQWDNLDLESDSVESKANRRALNQPTHSLKGVIEFFMIVDDQQDIEII